MGIVYYKERIHSNQWREEVQRAGPGNYQSGASVVCGVRALLSGHWCVTLCLEYGQPRKLTWTVVFSFYWDTVTRSWLIVCAADLSLQCPGPLCMTQSPHSASQCYSLPSSRPQANNSEITFQKLKSKASFWRDFLNKVKFFTIQIQCE